MVNRRGLLAQAAWTAGAALLPSAWSAAAAPLRLALLPRAYPGLGVQIIKRRGPVQLDPILINLPVPGRVMQQVNANHTPAAVAPSLSTSQIKGLPHALDRLSISNPSPLHS